MTYADRLHAAIHEKGCPIAVGIDPRIDRLPKPLQSLGPADALEAFGIGIVDAVASVVPAVKLQVAFFEQHGFRGVEAYEKIVAEARRRGLIVIGDVKRGDIGSTAAAYARAHLEFENSVDAITVNPLFGRDGLQPFIDSAKKCGRGLYILVKTSNPSSADIQDRQVDNRPLHEWIAELVVDWGKESLGDCGYSSVGAVVGGTHPQRLIALRELMPRVPLLIPGYGAQGAGAADVIRALDDQGQGALIAASRSIAQAFESRSDLSWQDAVHDAAVAMKKDIRQARGL